MLKMINKKGESTSLKHLTNSKAVTETPVVWMIFL